jgi:hypothetical protein
VLSLTRDDAVDIQTALLVSCGYKRDDDRSRAQSLLNRFHENEPSLRLDSIMRAGSCTLLLFTPVANATPSARPPAQTSAGSSNAQENLAIDEDDVQEMIHDIDLLIGSDLESDLDLSHWN